MLNNHHFDATEHPVRIAGEGARFTRRHISPKDQKRWIFIQYGMVAAMEAVNDAGITLPLSQPERVGVLVGVDWDFKPLSKRLTSKTKGANA